MSDDALRALRLTGRLLVNDEFLVGSLSPVFDAHVTDPELGRIVDVGALAEVLTHVIRSSDFAESPEKSDSWLAPRLHAALRLRRSEAADRRIWMWLAVVRFPEYVRWRFPGQGGTASKRFLGGDRDNALARLWWGAELTRDGGDYSATARAFERQDIPNTWLALDAFHNKAAALAAMRMLPAMSARDINRLSTAFNHYLTTVMLDAIAPVRGPDPSAIDDWVTAAPDAEALLEEPLPEGPDEDPMDSDLISKVEAFVRRVARETDIPSGGSAG